MTSHMTPSSWNIGSSSNPPPIVYEEQVYCVLDVYMCIRERDREVCVCVCGGGGGGVHCVFYIDMCTCVL